MALMTSGMRNASVAALLSMIACGSAHAESVNVKYRGVVALAPFICERITRSSFIDRVCYDPRNAYLLIELNGTWYHYCEIDQVTVSSRLGAPSMGRYHNAAIKGSFDFRTPRMPLYDDGRQ